MADIFDEVAEDLRRDRLRDSWRKYRFYLIAIVVLAIAIAGGNAAWRQYQQHRLEARSALFESAFSALRTGDRDTAIAALEKLAAQGGDMAAPVRLSRASLLLRQGDTAAAVSLYDSLAADSGTDDLYRGLALVLSVMSQLDTVDPAAALARLEPQMGPKAPWRLTAWELAALLSLRAGNASAASDYLNRILAVPTADAATRARAMTLLKVLERPHQ